MHMNETMTMIWWWLKNLDIHENDDDDNRTDKTKQSEQTWRQTNFCFEYDDLRRSACSLNELKTIVNLHESYDEYFDVWRKNVDTDKLMNSFCNFWFM